MKPIKIEFQAFGPYADYEVVDFEKIAKKGLFLICGKTGTGKTMILDAITFALYGQSSGNRSKDFSSMRCTSADDDKDTFVKFTFESNGNIYLFERTIKKKRVNFSESSNASIMDESGIWKPLFENSKKGLVSEKAEEIIGLDYSQFIQVIILPQGKFEQLLTSNSDEKEKILSSIFGEEKWQAIADKIYEKALARKQELDTTRVLIEKKLSDIQCENIEQLNELIEKYRQDLVKLNEVHKEGNYESRLAKISEVQAIINDFEQLENNEQKLEELLKEKSDIDDIESVINNATRASVVMPVLEDIIKIKNQLSQREKIEKDANNKLDLAKNNLKKIQDEYNAHKDVEKEISFKSERKILLESKRDIYKGLQAAINDVAEKKNKETAAKEEEKTAKEKFEAASINVSNEELEKEKLNSESDALLREYIIGISGELAKDLMPGDMCPVCGSTVHPKKATITDKSVTKQQVEAKKTELEKQEKVVKKALENLEKARNEYDTKKNVLFEISNQVISAISSLNEMKNHIIDGIDSLDDLNKSINLLDNEIQSYTEKKAELTQLLENANAAYSEANANVTMAAKEKENEQKNLALAESNLENALNENGFTSKEEVSELYKKQEEIDLLRKRIITYNTIVKTEKEHIESIKKKLDGINKPDKESVDKELKEIQDAISKYDSESSVIKYKIDEYTKIYDDLKSQGEDFLNKSIESRENLEFAKKLRGDSGTSLQRYVLGIMFQSVVAAANRMLEMVHGGRYRLFRTDDVSKSGGKKKGLELKVYDKYSEDHEGRFVSSLSGGEKFLVSLALSIGMSTVAQKSGIKIEALFIDEGFGSLDEDSISDAMNILNSIQESNGLVGIISHVQLLQERIPTKLRIVETEKGSKIVQSVG